MEMRFGKYRGSQVKDLPRSYLEWLLTVELSDALRGAVMQALMERNTIKGSFKEDKPRREQSEQNTRDYVPGEVSHVYTDGGVDGKNPSKKGGAWAWRQVDCDGKVLKEDCGYVTPGELCVEAVTNNITELLAVVFALEALPIGWVGTVCLDSDCTRLRFMGFKRSWTATPAAIYNRARAAQQRADRLYWLLLSGHPERGKHEYLPQSEHNAACDLMCNLVMRDRGAE